MFRSQADIRNKIHLIISICIVIPAALVYGFYPELVYPDSVIGINLQNSLKAVMVFYLGFAWLWVLGILSPKYLKPALISNTVFMLGLGFGRAISFATDGLPALFFTIGTVGEFILGFYGLSLLYNEKK